MRSLMFLLLCGCQAPHAYSDLDGQVVIDGADDASGVTVRAIGPALASVTTDSDGRYRLPSLPPGDYALTFDAADTLEDHQLLQLAVSPAPRPAPDVHFTATGTLEGSVTLAGQAQGGAVVFVDGASAAATCDAMGRYHLAKVPAGLRTLQAVLAGYHSAELPPIAVRRGQVTEEPPLDLAVDGDAPFPVAALAGRALRYDRDDHSGTKVVATRGATQLTTTTAADGSYHFDGLPTGLYSLEFDYDGQIETIPQVLALGGSTGQVVDDALYPLEPNPLRLPVARRLSHDLQQLQLIDADRLLVAKIGGVSNNDYLLQILSLSDGSLTPLADDANRSSQVVLAKSLKHLLYAAGVGSQGGALRIVGLDGTPPMTLADLTNNYGYTFSKDESLVVFQSGTQLFSVPVGGGTPLAIGSGVSGNLQFLPDGQRVAYLSCSSSTSCHVALSRIDGGGTVSVVDGTGPFSLSPDGSWVLNVANYDYNAGTGQLWLASTDGSHLRKLWDGAIYPYTFPWSPDGRYAAYVTDLSDLRVLDTSSDTDPPSVAAKAQQPSYSADGSRLVYAADYQQDPRTFDLRQQPPGGGPEVKLGTRVDSFLLSNDGSRTLFLDGIDAASRLGDLRIADPAGKVTLLANAVFPSFQLTGDGARVLYRTAHPTRFDVTRLWSVPLAGGAPVSLGDVASLPVSSPAGTWAVWADGDAVLQLARAAGGTTRVAGVGYPSWPSDSRLLLSVSQIQPPYRHQNGIYVLEVTP